MTAPDRGRRPSTGLRPELLAAPLAGIGLVAFLAPVVGLIALIVLAAGGVVVVVRQRLRDRAPGEGTLATAFSGLPLALLIGISAGLASFVPTVGILLLVGLVVVTLFRFGRLQASSVAVVYVATLFLISSKYTVGPFSITAAGAVAALLGLMWGTAKILPSADAARGWNQAVAGLLAYGLVTLFAFAVSSTELVSTVQQKNAQRLMSISFLAIAGALAIADLVRERRLLRRILGMWVAGGTAVGIIAILQYTVDFDVAQWLAPPGLSPKGDPSFIQEREGFTRVAGTFQHPIELAVITGVTLPLALHFARFGRTDLSRTAARVSVLILALALPTAVSRSGIVALGVAVAVSALVWPVSRLVKVIIGAATMAFMSTLLFPGLLELIGSLFTDRDESTIGRQVRNEYAYSLVTDTRVFTGRGLGWYVPGDHPSIGVLDNFWTDQLVNQGVIGIAGMILVAVAGFAEARRLSRVGGDRVDQDLAMTLSGMTFGILAAGWGLSFYYYPMTFGLLMAAVGCIGALGRITDGEQASVRRALAGVGSG